MKKQSEKHFMLKSKTLILAALVLNSSNIFSGDNSGEGRPFSPAGRRPSTTADRLPKTARPANLSGSTSAIALGAVSPVALRTSSIREL